MQAYIQQRESEVNAGVQKLKGELQGKASFAEAMWKEIQPYDEMIRGEGGNPVAAVRDLLGMAATMRRGTPEQKRHILLSTARQFGVDLSGADDPGSQPDPMIQALQNEIYGLKNQFQTREQQAIEQQRQTLQSEIDRFKADKPHFEQVRGVMGELIQIGRATDLQDAYDKAIRLDDGLFSQLQADAKRREAEQQTSAQRERASRAKAAGVSVSGAPGMAGNGSSAPAPTVRAELERAFASGRA